MAPPQGPQRDEEAGSVPGTEEPQSQAQAWGLRWWRICLQCRRPDLDLSIRAVPWRRAWPCSALAWRIPQTEEPGGLQSTGSQRVGHDRVPFVFRSQAHGTDLISLNPNVISENPVIPYTEAPGIVSPIRRSCCPHRNTGFWCLPLKNAHSPQTLLATHPSRGS